MFHNQPISPACYFWVLSSSLLPGHPCFRVYIQKRKYTVVDLMGLYWVCNGSCFCIHVCNVGLNFRVKQQRVNEHLAMGPLSNRSLESYRVVFLCIFHTSTSIKAHQGGSSLESSPPALTSHFQTDTNSLCKVLLAAGPRVHPAQHRACGEALGLSVSNCYLLLAGELLCLLKMNSKQTLRANS